MLPKGPKMHSNPFGTIRKKFLVVCILYIRKFRDMPGSLGSLKKVPILVQRHSQTLKAAQIAVAAPKSNAFAQRFYRIWRYSNATFSGT